MPISEDTKREAQGIRRSNQARIDSLERDNQEMSVKVLANEAVISRLTRINQSIRADIPDPEVEPQGQ